VDCCECVLQLRAYGVACVVVMHWEGMTCTMRVYEPPQVKDEIAQAGPGQPSVGKGLEKIREWAKRWGMQRVQAQADHKLPGKHLVFRLGRSHRLIARCDTVDGHEVLVLLRVTARGDTSYVPMLDRIRNGDYVDLAPIDEDALRANMCQPWRDELEPTPTPNLPDDLHVWIEPPPLVTSAGYVVFESHEWVSAFATKPIQDFWQDFPSSRMEGWPVSRREPVTICGPTG